MLMDYFINRRWIKWEYTIWIRQTRSNPTAPCCSSCKRQLPTLFCLLWLEIHSTCHWEWEDLQRDLPLALHLSSRCRCEGGLSDTLQIVQSCLEITSPLNGQSGRSSRWEEESSTLLLCPPEDSRLSSYTSLGLSLHRSKMLALTWVECFQASNELYSEKEALSTYWLKQSISHTRWDCHSSNLPVQWVEQAARSEKEHIAYASLEPVLSFCLCSQLRTDLQCTSPLYWLFFFLHKRKASCWSGIELTSLISLCRTLFSLSSSTRGQIWVLPERAKPPL